MNTNRIIKRVFLTGLLIKLPEYHLIIAD